MLFRPRLRRCSGKTRVSSNCRWEGTPRDRKRMSIRSPEGKEALTPMASRGAFREVTLLEVVIRREDTSDPGSSQHHRASVIGDRTYGTPAGLQSISDRGLRAKLAEMKRQALHAGTLVFIHP